MQSCLLACGAGAGRGGSLQEKDARTSSHPLECCSRASHSSSHTHFQPSVCPAGVLRREPTVRLQQEKEIPRILRGLTKNHRRRRLVGNASPVAGPERSESGACVAGAVRGWLELGRRVPASRCWHGEDQQVIRNSWLELRGLREVKQQEAWVAWSRLLQQLLSWLHPL